jgi:uncharacterized membrane protein YgcG
MFGRLMIFLGLKKRPAPLSMQGRPRVGHVPPRPVPPPSSVAEQQWTARRPLAAAPWPSPPPASRNDDTFMAAQQLSMLSAMQASHGTAAESPRFADPPPSCERWEAPEPSPSPSYDSGSSYSSSDYSSSDGGSSSCGGGGSD